MATTTTLILDAGFGGIVTANALRRRLPADHHRQLLRYADVRHYGPIIELESGPPASVTLAVYCKES